MVRAILEVGVKELLRLRAEAETKVFRGLMVKLPYLLRVGLWLIMALRGILDYTPTARLKPPALHGLRVGVRHTP